LVLSVYTTNTSVKKEYVSLCIQILSKDAQAEGSSSALRPWAVELLNRSAPVPLPKDVQKALGGGLAYLPPSGPNVSTTSYSAALAEPTTDAPLEAIKLINSTLSLLQEEDRDSRLEARVILELTRRRDSIIRQQFGDRVYKLLLRLREKGELSKEELNEVESERLWDEAKLKTD
jgi:hypothetical protein